MNSYGAILIRTFTSAEEARAMNVGLAIEYGEVQKRWGGGSVWCG